MKRPRQSKLSFGKGRDTGQDEETERKRKREGEEDERGRAGTVHCAQDRISFMSLCGSTQSQTDLIQFKQCHYHRDINYMFFGNYSRTYRLNLTTQTPE